MNQTRQTLATIWHRFPGNLLPWLSGVGTKKNSKKHKTSWTGYKRHIDAADGEVESPGGTSPPGAHRTVREPLDSYGSS